MKHDKINAVKVTGDDLKSLGEIESESNSVVISSTISLGGSSELLVLKNMINDKKSYFILNEITDGVSGGAKYVDAFDPFTKTDPQGQQQPDDSETFTSTSFTDDLTGETKYFIGEVILSTQAVITDNWYIRSLTGITNGYIKAYIGDVTDPNEPNPNWKTNNDKDIKNKTNLVTNVGGAGIDIPFKLGESYFQNTGDDLSFIIIADNPFSLQGATFAASPPYSTEIPYILADGTNWRSTGLVKQSTQGWAFYTDDVSADLVVTTSDTKLLINGLGSNTNEDFLPEGNTSIWDSSTSKMTPFVAGASYDVRIQLDVTALSANPTQINFKLDIGGGATPTIVIMEQTITLKNNVPQSIVISTPIFCLDTFVANGGQMFMSTNTGTLTIENRTILLVRTS